MRDCEFRKTVQLNLLKMAKLGEGTGVHFNPLRLIEEVKKRPSLYVSRHPSDRLERLRLWKEIGAALLPNWGTFNKATIYHAVLQIQRKWRSLRDAYNRELRTRRSGTKVNRRVYIYFKSMSFLGGFEGTISEEDETVNDATIEIDPLVNSHLQAAKPRAKKRRRMKKSSSGSSAVPEEVEMPAFSNVEIPSEMDSDTDKLFLLSFVPEMRQLPINIKMWTRAQIANVMQEAVSCHYNNTQPGSIRVEPNEKVKRQRMDSTD